MILHLLTSLKVCEFFFFFFLRSRVCIINNLCVSDRIPARSDNEKTDKSPTLNNKQSNRYEFWKLYRLSIIYYNMSCSMYELLCIIL